MNRTFTILLLSAVPGLAFAQDATPMTPAPAAVEGTPEGAAVSLLLRQGQRWLDIDRLDLAASSVERALAAEPGNVDALLLGAKVEVARNNRAASNAYVARLRSAGATPEQQKTGAAVLREGSIDPAALETARRLAREGNTEDAIAHYRALFGQGDPPPAYAREYYQLLVFNDSTRMAGQTGLAQLAARPDADDRTLLANAQAQTFSSSTRSAGIAELSKLVDHPTIAAQAQAAWKQGLGFYGQDPAALPLLNAYLQRFPGTSEIMRQRDLIDTAKQEAPVDPTDALRQSAFAALNSGSLETSAQRFTESLAARPNSADALGGLGIVRLRQNRSSEAKDLLQRAIAADPDHASQWQKALDGADYSLELADARGLLRQGDTAGAYAELSRALRRDVEDKTDAESLMGDVALKRGDQKEAEQHFRAALARRPGFAPSVVGLNQSLRAQGRLAEIPRTAAQPASGYAPFSSTATAATDAVRAEAARTSDPTIQAALLGNAVTTAPDDPWLRLDLARVLRKLGRNAEARALVEELAARRPGPDTDYAAALLAQEDRRPADALALLSRIPPARLTADMARLQARVRTQDDVANSAQLLGSSPIEARNHLVSLAARPDPTGGTATDVIRALGNAGDRVGAGEAGRVAAAVNRDPSAQIAIAGALLGVGLDADAMALAARLDGNRLTEAQRRDVAILRTNTIVRVSDRLNEGGNQAAAFERLRPALASDPENPDVQLALARLYQGARNPAEAMRIADAVLARNPRNIDARQGAVDAAIANGDRRHAAALADQGVALMPGNSQAILLQANVARANGNIRQARTLLAQAATARQAELGMTPDGSAGTAPGLVNPFSDTATATPAAAGVSHDPVSDEIAKEQAALQLDAASHVVGTIVVRSRSGQAGLDQLVDISTPLEASFEPAGIGGRVTAVLTPVILDAGTLSGAASTLRFGSNAASGSNLVPSSKGATGAALDVAYKRDIVSVDAGSSPLGFPVSNIVGGIEVAPKLTNLVTLRLLAERRSVLDSLLSYGGERDPVSGITWGGVTQTSGHAQVEAGIGAGYIYAGGGYAIYDGTHVKRNSKIEAGAGLGYPIFKQDDTELTTGFNAIYFGFDNNQRGFTLGQGGYFSPQNFVSVNVPIDYRSRWGNLLYHVGASLGYAKFREEASVLFPSDPGLQAAAVAAAASNALIPTTNLGQSKTGFVGGVRIDVTYPLTNTLQLAGSLTYDKAAEWEESKVSVRLQQQF